MAIPFLLLCLVVAGRSEEGIAPRNSSTADSGPQLELKLRHSEPEIWENGVGEGFRSTTSSLGLAMGANHGLPLLGGKESHDIALVSFSYGHMLGSVCGRDHWYRGNWELRGELLAGTEFSPSKNWLVGLTPHLRYSLATGTRWVPFMDCGAGLTLTGIGAPDLGGTFEFNLQAGGGVQWFIRKNLALSLEARYLHLSSAGIYRPNLGVNGVAGLLGLTCFF